MQRDIASPEHPDWPEDYEVYVADFGLARAQAAEVATTKQNFGPIAVRPPRFN